MRKNRRWWLAVHHLEGRGAKRCVEGSIVAILCPPDLVYPGAQSVPYDTVEVHGDHLVDDLRLAVRLRVECCTQAELDASHLEEVAPHVTGEDRVVVADDGRGVVKTNDAIEEGTSDRGS